MSIKIEIFSSPGCSKCVHSKKQLLKLADEYGPDVVDVIDVNVLEQLDYAVSLGIVTTPAVAINGKLYFSGMPSIKNIKHEIDTIAGRV